MRIAISFWTFFNISSDKTDPFCALFCNRFYSETEEIYSNTGPVSIIPYLVHILKCFYSLSFLSKKDVTE